MAEAADHLPEDAAALKAALIETRAKLSGAEALIAHLQLTIAKMKRAMFGPRSERSQRLIDQLELQLEELAAAAGEDEAKAEAPRVQVQGFTRRSGTRRNFPADLPRRRIVHPAPTSCPCCGGSKLSKIGEDVTETLDVVPRQWFVTAQPLDRHLSVPERQEEGEGELDRVKWLLRESGNSFLDLNGVHALPSPLWELSFASISASGILGLK